MTDLEYYRDLIDSIFGVGVASRSQDEKYSNIIIGALNHKTEFKSFSNCFIERLKRLNKVYPNADANRKNIIDQLNLIASDNWEGAYSELAAFDFLNQECDAKIAPIDLNIDIDAKRSYAIDMGGKGPANLDGHYAGWDIYFDVKVLKDNAKELLGGICDDVYARLGKSKFLIRPEYPLHMTYDDIEKNRQALIKELIDEIDVTKETRFIRSKIIDELAYRIELTSGVSVTISGYNPYEHAEKHYKLAFRHVKKFVKDRPFFLVFVVFPWFNNVITDFRQSNRIFYRSFARRVFCQHIKDTQSFSSFNKKYKGTDTVYDASRKLSGILFLEDQCILSDQPKEFNVKSYVYFNPNADNKIRNTFFFDCILQQRLNEIEDFEHDNY